MNINFASEVISTQRKNWANRPLNDHLIIKEKYRFDWIFVNVKTSQLTDEKKCSKLIFYQADKHYDFPDDVICNIAYSLQLVWSGIWSAATTEVGFWTWIWSTSRSSHQRCSIRKGVFRNFTKFTGIHLCQSLFKSQLY